MITRTIEYVDYDGNKRKEKHYFNLTQFEATEIAMEIPDDVMDDLGGENDTQEEKIATARTLSEKLGKKGVMDFIKNIVLRSYGVKSPDGKRFIKSEQLSTEFSQTLAFSSFMMRLMSDDLEASRFINGVIPTELAASLRSKSEKPDVIDMAQEND